MAKTPKAVTNMRVIGTLAPQTADTQAPTTPTGFVATVISAGRVDLSWTASSDNVGVAGYQIWRDGEPLNTTSGTTYSDSTLPSTTYTYTVSAYDAAGNSSGLAVNQQVTTPANAAPSWTNPGAQSLTVGNSYSLNLATFVSDADSDAITFSTASGTLPSGIALTGSVVSGTPTTAGQNQSVTFSASDQFHTVNQAISFTTYNADVTAPPVPTGLAASAVNSSQINLSWNASTDAAGSANELVSGTKDYRVYRSTDGVSFSLRTTVTSPSYQDTGLGAGTQYYYKVTSRDNALNESAQSSAQSATTTSSSQPLILYTDAVAIPLTGGESNKGGYLTICGINFGSQSGMGTTTKVLIGGVEVDNYRYLGNAVQPGGFDPPIQQITVQPGSLGGLAAGSTGAIQVVVGGVGSNTNFMLMNQPGPIKFVNPSTGSDSNPGTMASPLKNIQTASGTKGSGAPTGGAIVDTTITPPGTYIILRAGTYTQTGKDNYLGRFWRTTGIAPTGANNAGYLTLTAYPGPIGGNAIEDAHLAGTGDCGGLAGNDQARASESTPFGTTGYGQYIVISNLRIDLAATCTDAPINLSSSGNFWRVVNNKLGPWQASVYGKAACVAGNGNPAVIYGNYCHDLASPTNENHGIYMDGSYVIAKNMEVAYNYIKNMNGGSGIQCYNAQASGNFTGITIHHNYIDTTLKYGINFADSSQGVAAWDNLILNTGSYGFRTNCSGVTMALSFVHNTLYNCFTGSGGTNSMIGNDWNLTAGYLEIKNNILVMGAGRSNPTLNFYGNGGSDTVTVLANNLYYDPQGNRTTKYSGDATGIYGNPLFATAYTDFKLQSGSPAINAGANSGLHVAVSVDFNQATQPRSGNTKPTIGAFA